MNIVLCELLRNEKDSSLASQQKISMMYKNINQIGSYLPFKFAGVTRLFISNNNITSLCGIEQFKNLTHLSIAYNLIENINEFDRIYDKLILISLSVKGNFFCKNPHSNIILIKKFPKLRILDGFKISEATYKVLNETEKMMENVMKFFSNINKKKEKIQKITHLIKLNNEFEQKYTNELNDPISLDEKIKKIKTLIKVSEYNNFLDNEVYNEKYLNKNINPSVHVMKKIITQFINEELKINQNEYRKIYEKIFDELIQKYESKNNYNELPFYLNYLIIKANPQLERFLLFKANQYLSQLNNKNFTNLDLFPYLSKNLPQILIESSNCSPEMIRKFQMMMFYRMNIGTENEILTYEEPKIIIENGKEIINLNELIKITCLFLNNFEATSFPIFALNFDYMRNLTTIIQNKIESYNDEFIIIKKVLNQLNEYKNRLNLIGKPQEIRKFITKSRSRSKSGNFDKKGKSDNNTNDNSLFKYNFADNYYSRQQNDKSKRGQSNKSNKSGSGSFDRKKSPIDELIMNNIVSKSNTNNNYEVFRKYHCDKNVNNIKLVKKNIIQKSESQEKRKEKFEVNTEIEMPNEQCNFSNINQIRNDKKKYQEHNQKSINPNTNVPNYDKENGSNKIVESLDRKGYLKDEEPKASQIPPHEPVQYYYIPPSKTKENELSPKISEPIPTYNQYQIPIQSPINNELFTLSGEPFGGQSSQSSGSNYTSSFCNSANPRVRRLANIGKGYTQLSSIIFKNIFKTFSDNLYEVHNRTKVIHFIMILNRINFSLFKIKFFSYLKCINTLFDKVTEIKRRISKELLFKGIKENFIISKYESNFYFWKLKSKSLYGLYKNKVMNLERKHKENKVMYYYYTKLIKKLFLTLKYNLHDKKMQRESNEYNNKIYNFFHQDENSDLNYDKYNEMINNKFIFSKETNDSEDLICKSKSETKVDDLLSHLLGRYNELSQQTKKMKKVEFNENEKENCSKGYYDTVKEYSEKVTKKNIKKLKLKKKVSITCPYCVSKILHDKCVGISNNEGSLVMGAPNFIKNTANFIHKNL